jgi:hypothetical protein
MSTFPSLVLHALCAVGAVISLPSSAGDKATHGIWQRISEPNAMPGFYYDPLSIKQVKVGFVAVTTIINYISDEGNKESLLGMTVYDCARRVKQEQSTEQYTQYWADGEIKLKLGLEEPWGTVKVGTDGMRLLKTVCAPA